MVFLDLRKMLKIIKYKCCGGVFMFFYCVLNICIYWERSWFLLLFRFGLGENF